MTDQPPTLTASTDLEVLPERLSLSTETEWRPGSRQSGLDDRVEFAEVGDRVAVRDPGRPNAPALLVPRAEWDALYTTTPDTVDLRPLD